MKDFSKLLINWYKQNKRDLPWRKETDPYKIWLSEIILQQTQVVQGLKYYIAFTETFPGIKDLAEAKEDQVLKLWQGLGYYSRARNLHAAAKHVVEQHGGIFPETYESIAALKGVGPYTAAAIASIAYKLPHAVVDGNVYRVLSRVFGINTPIDSGTGKKEFQALADKLLDRKQPDLHNQALMEFGALHCRPVNPDCKQCLFKHQCVGLLTDRISFLPVKQKKTAIKNRYLNYFVFIDTKKRVAVTRRETKDIWQGLYEFLLHETGKPLLTEHAPGVAAHSFYTDCTFNVVLVSKEYKHILSHQHLYARFYVCRLNRAFRKNEKVIPLNNLHSLAFPRLIEKFLKDCKLEKLV